MPKYLTTRPECTLPQRNQYRATTEWCGLSSLPRWVVFHCRENMDQRNFEAFQYYVHLVRHPSLIKHVPLYLKNSTKMSHLKYKQIICFLQKCIISHANAPKILASCTQPSKYCTEISQKTFAKQYSRQWFDFNRLVQERRNSSALALELRLSCTNPLTCHSQTNKTSRLMTP